MPIKVLMIALNTAFLALFEQLQTPYELYVLEEREIYEANPHAYSSAAIKELRFGEYQQSERFLPEVCQWHEQVHFDIVVPGMEYSVPASFAFASEAGLTSPGEKAIRACTNKYQLRVTAEGLGIPQPYFAAVRAVEDIENFFNGVPIIVKPTNRRASVGVIRIDQQQEIRGAWEETTQEGEGKRVVNRDLHWEYMVESFVDGYEVSIESLVFRGHPVFHNITSKQTTNGRYFAETEHIVPAKTDRKTFHDLIAYKNKLLQGLEVQAGVFHSEWKVDITGPKLIECAARMPGDLIPRLIREAYDFDLYEAWLQVLQGQAPNPPSKNRYVAAVRFFKPTPGTFERIEGEELLRTMPQVIAYEINIKPGQRIPPFKNSWTRMGYYALRCDNYQQLQESIDTIERGVRFLVS